MKINLPLPNDDQRTFELKNKKLDYKNSQDIKRLGVPFHLAVVCNINFTEYDLEYINRNIKTHKLFRIITEHNANVANRVVFFEHFAKDSKCPENVQKFLFLYISSLYRKMVATNEYTTFEQRRPLIENWFYKCR